MKITRDQSCGVGNIDGTKREVTDSLKKVVRQASHTCESLAWISRVKE